ncbi:MAG: hypothetical protein JSU65_11960 [Candidatus Zixiibacteriota bacterium]|nr:MAG: hypothetical protein JSU65_11960 [candidate division Zixibacteria bacterium]
MIYVVFILLAALVCLLFLRIRVRLVVEGRTRRLLFVGLGRSGADLDFVEKRGTLKVAGLGIKRFEIGKEAPEKAKKPKKKPKEKPARKRHRSVVDIIKAVPQSVRALGAFGLGLLKSVVLEEAEGTVEAGFDQPDLTGITFGYYQAALAVAPSLVGRVQYLPDWTGGSFTGSLRVAVAIPVYKIGWRTIILLRQLPLRKLWKVAIGTKRGDQDGQ